MHVRPKWGLFILLEHFKLPVLPNPKRFNSGRFNSVSFLLPNLDTYQVLNIYQILDIYQIIDIKYRKSMVSFKILLSTEHKFYQRLNIYQIWDIYQIEDITTVNHGFIPKLRYTKTWMFTKYRYLQDLAYKPNLRYLRRYSMYSTCTFSM
jgi:hypothetical protein